MSHATSRVAPERAGAKSPTTVTAAALAAASHGAKHPPAPLLANIRNASESRRRAWDTEAQRTTKAAESEYGVAAAVISHTGTSGGGGGAAGGGGGGGGQVAFMPLSAVLAAAGPTVHEAGPPRRMLSMEFSRAGPPAGSEPGVARGAAVPRFVDGGMEVPYAAHEYARQLPLMRYSLLGALAPCVACNVAGTLLRAGDAPAAATARVGACVSLLAMFLFVGLRASNQVRFALPCVVVVAAGACVDVAIEFAVLCARPGTGAVTTACASARAGSVPFEVVLYAAALCTLLIVARTHWTSVGVLLIILLPSICARCVTCVTCA